MTIEIKPNRYFSAFWFIEGDEGNWLASLFKDPGEPWQLVYRFRYFVDDKIHDSDDKRSWWRGTGKDGSPESEAALSMSLNKIADEIMKRFGGELHKLILKTDDANKVLEAMGGEEWCSLRIENPQPTVTEQCLIES